MMKEIRKKDHTIESPKFFIFDILTLEEFDSASSNVKLSDRLNRFEIDNDFVTKLEQVRLANYDINSYPEEWEGLILRNDCGYEGKRTANLLKVKKFLDDEFKVIDIETGPYRIIDRGKEIEFETLTNVLINYNHNIVSVGSGFTVDERRYYYERPDEIIGATITVQYFGISKNKEGKESLRFPTVKTIHGNSRTV
jgi:DNA ligase-1